MIAECLSRAPVMPASEADEEVLMSALQCKVMDELAPCQQLVESANKDKSYQEFITLILNSCPANKLPHALGGYKPVWCKLSVVGGMTNRLVVYNHNRIVVPEDARPAILQQLHSSHCGITKLTQYAQHLYFWPLLTLDVKELVANCEACQTLRPSVPAEPCAEQAVPLAPMSDVRLEEMVQQKSKLRTAYSYDAIRIAKRDSSQSSTPTSSSRKEQPEATQEAQPPHEEEHMEDDIDAEAEHQPDTDQGSEADREIDALLEAQPHMEDLGSDMEQEGRQPLNWAEEAEREECLRENPQAGQHHHS